MRALRGKFLFGFPLVPGATVDGGGSLPAPRSAAFQACCRGRQASSPLNLSPHRNSLATAGNLGASFPRVVVHASPFAARGRRHAPSPSTVPLPSQRLPEPREPLPPLQAAKASSDPTTSSDRTKLGVTVAAVIVLGVANRLLYKMALVPMGNYAFFLSQLQCFGYVLVYGCILATRRRSGAVTPEMLKCPKGPFAAVGFLEAVSSLTQIMTAVRLPGALLPLLSQSMVMWQLMLSALLLGRRYTFRQVASACVVIAGVVLAGMPPRGLSSPSSDPPALDEYAAAKLPLPACARLPEGTIEAVRPMDAALYTCSMGIIALAVIIKERIFRDSKERMGGKDLDLFVVNTTGSAFQALFVFLSLPVLTKLRGLSLAQLPEYLSQGAQVMMGQVPAGAPGVDPTGAPLAPLLYVVLNLGFNISALYLLRVAGSIVAALTISSILPLTVWAFSFPLPLLGDPAPLGPAFGVGFVILMLGMWAFNTAPKPKDKPS